MKLRYAFSALAVALATAGAAQAAVYTYTGNTAAFDSIHSEPSRIVAHFDFDFENSYEAVNDVYTFKSWDVSYGCIKLSSAAGHDLWNRFTFDAAMNVTGWYFSAGDPDVLGAVRSIQSLSENFIFFGPNEANDIAIVQDPFRAAAVYGNPGVWSIAPSVPEPATYLMLGLGLAAVGLASRKQRG